MASVEQQTAPSGWAPLKRPVFRALWLAQTGSNLGGWMQTVAAQWFLVQHGSGSAVIAWVQAASLLPVLFLSIIAGVLADRYDRRRLLIVMTLASTVLAIVLTVVSAIGLLGAGSLLAMTFFLGCSAALTMPAWQAVQPDLVSREEIPAAASLGSITVNAARAVGPAIAGLLVAGLGPTFVFGVNAVSFLGVTAVLLWWHPAKKAVAGWREPFGDAVRAVTRYVVAAPGVRRILLRCLLFSFPASALWALLPSATVDQLHLGATGYGLVLGLLGVGSVIGAFLMPVANRRLTPSTVLGVSTAIFALGTVGIVWFPIAVVAPILLLTGIAWTASLTVLNAAMQLTVAGWVRARVIAVYVLALMGGQGVGSFVWGALSARIGVPATLVTAAVLLVIVALSVLVLPLRAETGKLDRSVLPYCAPEPQLVFEPESTDGPVTVSVVYDVAEADTDAFLAAAARLRDSRRRTGAMEWTLERSGEHEHRFREEFRTRSWAEYHSTRTERWTGYDASVLADLQESSVQEPEEHYFVAPVPRRRASRSRGH